MMETFTSESGFRDALGNTPMGDRSAAEHNDRIGESQRGDH
jgi:hypothetical protein